MKYHLAQINIAKIIAPNDIDSAFMADFVADIDRINAIAEKSKGFVWRLKDETNDNATDINAFNDPSLIINVSVWESWEDLKNFAYKSEHIEVFVKRAKWFERMKEAYTAMWWTPAGIVPTPEEARDKLLYLRKHGDSETSFGLAFIQKK